MKDKCPKCGAALATYSHETDNKDCLRRQLATLQATVEEVKSQRDQLLDKSFDFESGVASALGWDCKGEPFVDIIRRHKATIDKLPKCWRLVDGKLVQDVPVVPGMEAWLPDEGAGEEEGFVSMDMVTDVTDTGQVRLRWTNGGSGGTPPCNWPHTDSFANTREAAIAVREAATEAQAAAAREKEGVK